MWLYAAGTSGRAPSIQCLSGCDSWLIVLRLKHCLFVCYGCWKFVLFYVGSGSISWCSLQVTAITVFYCIPWYSFLMPFFIYCSTWLHWNVTVTFGIPADDSYCLSIRYDGTVPVDRNFSEHLELLLLIPVNYVFHWLWHCYSVSSSWRWWCWFRGETCILGRPVILWSNKQYGEGGAGECLWVAGLWYSGAGVGRRVFWSFFWLMMTILHSWYMYSIMMVPVLLTF